MKSVLLALALLGTYAHAGNVDITTNPSKPIVFTSDFTYQDDNGNSVIVKGPWFQLSVNINNRGVDALTLIGLHVEVTGTDMNGKTSTVTTDFVPSQFNYTSRNGGRCIYQDFGQFAPSSSGELALDPTAAGCNSGTINFFLSGNPDLGSTNSIVYHVKVQPIGWFGTSGSPKDRFDDFVMIDTQ